MIPLKDPINIYNITKDHESKNLIFKKSHSINSINPTYYYNDLTRIYACNLEEAPGSIILFKENEYNHNITQKMARDKLITILSQDAQSLITDKYLHYFSNKFTNLKECPYGVGTILYRIFNFFELNISESCSCIKHAYFLNIKGVEWCNNNIDYILDLLKIESNKRKIHFVKSDVEKIVHRAIKQSKKYEKRRLYNNS